MRHEPYRLRDRATEAQQYRASGLAIVTAAIALWNTVYLGRALDDLRRGREIIPDPLLAHLAPVGWQHIIMRRTLCGMSRNRSGSAQLPEAIRSEMGVGVPQIIAGEIGQFESRRSGPSQPDPGQPGCRQPDQRSPVGRQPDPRQFE